MHLHCQDDCDIKASRLANNSLYFNSNRSAPNLLTEVPLHAATNALRSHLHHLLPRYAYFRARVQIHNVSNIPLVSGSFSIRWKFKNVHSAPGSKHKLLGIVKTRTRPGSPLTQTEFPQNKLNSKEGSDDSANGTGPGSSNTHIPAADPRSRHLATPITYPSSRTTIVSPDLPHDVMPLAGFTFAAPLPSNIASPIQSHCQSPAQSTFSPLSPGSDIPTVRVRTPTLPSLLTSKPSSSGERDLTSAARGQTLAVELKDHAVVWNHAVNTVLRIDVSRHTGILAISPLKLIVQQPLKKDAPNPSDKARLGVLYLNLAEYADKGAVERKFLLKESKSNAILKLTIELEHIGGADDYVAPPLPQGEIMNGIASLLEKDLYCGGCFRGAGKIRHTVKEPIPASRQASQASVLISEPSPVSQKSTFDSPIDPHFPFTMNGLPGAKNIEALIDALFNPAVTTDKEKESPFTVYIPQDELESTSGLDANPRRHLLNLEAASMYSTASSSEDAWTTARTVSSHMSAAHSDASSSKSASKSMKTRKLHFPLGPSHHESSEAEQPLDNSRNVKGWWKRRIAPRPATSASA
ncbi:hypothetical protein APHAL10511_007286 [Amanita phalloides]|nr:hypothetical protein APHAL10511_007286 [Amanita phalloides]